MVEDEKTRRVAVTTLHSENEAEEHLKMRTKGFCSWFGGFESSGKLTYVHSVTMAPVPFPLEYRAWMFLWSRCISVPPFRWIVATSWILNGSTRSRGAEVSA